MRGQIARLQNVEPYLLIGNETCGIGILQNGFGRCEADGHSLILHVLLERLPRKLHRELKALNQSIAAEIVWFRADRLQDEGRYVELAQLANVLALMEPHTPEVWSYAAWNLAYNVSVMMATPEDRWRWVQAALHLLRDKGLVLNPDSPELHRELAWLFELKLGLDLDSAAETYRQKWKEIVEDVKARGAWDELKMDPVLMARIEQTTGFDDWTDPQLSAIYWAAKGNLPDVVQQASIIYSKRHPVDSKP